eukprot:TRINITY_DN17152_c0_g2_i1.p2 TRINITY_DN17152_c0_g2~~TRINITY_DN17152_c0_g2_i1.p2  ORF type:complete len:333 (+),score=88.57 TRINITY_DN17152_c0_g2_i1:90-1001(+)
MSCATSDALPPRAAACGVAGLRGPLARPSKRIVRAARRRSPVSKRRSGSAGPPTGLVGAVWGVCSDQPRPPPTAPPPPPFATQEAFSVPRAPPPRPSSAPPPEVRTRGLRVLPSERAAAPYGVEADVPAATGGVPRQLVTAPYACHEGSDSAEPQLSVVRQSRRKSVSPPPVRPARARSRRRSMSPPSAAEQPRRALRRRSLSPVRDPTPRSRDAGGVLAVLRPDLTRAAPSPRPAAPTPAAADATERYLEQLLATIRARKAGDRSPAPPPRPRPRRKRRPPPDTAGVPPPPECSEYIAALLG